MGLQVRDRPHRNWDGILKNWLVLREQGKYPPPPHHWTAYDNTPRCACCGTVLKGIPRNEVGRKAPRCPDHAALVAAIEEEFHVDE
jgi:hypothetical protein